MHKKYYLTIIVSHLAVALTLLFPVLRVDVIRLGLYGGTTTSAHYLNLFDYIINDINTLAGIFILVLAIMNVAGIAIAIYGIFSKTKRSLPVILSFALGFSSATMSALQIYLGSFALLVISIVSFALIAFSSIKLMKIDEK
ncbi:MAG: hypothetical protein IJD42_02100 [Clostridia bacterium]|nr:hypothetical protein [Clostridia bacterium]